MQKIASVYSFTLLLLHVHSMHDLISGKCVSDNQDVFGAVNTTIVYGIV